MAMDPVEVDEETENFWRSTHIVLNEIPYQLRLMFKEKWNMKYSKTPWDDMPSSGKTFWQGESSGNKRFLDMPRNNSTKLSLLNGDCETWDSTTLFFVLLSSYHQLLSYPRPKGSRTPPLKDSEYVDILREERNLISHIKEAKLSQVEFDKLIQTVEMAFKGIGFPVDGINKMTCAVLQTRDVKDLEELLKKEVERNGLLKDEVDSISKKTDSISKKTDSIAEKTDSIAKKTDSIAEKTDSIAERTDSIAKKTDSMAERTDSIAEKTDSMAKRTDSIAKNQDSISKNQIELDQRLSTLEDAVFVTPADQDIEFTNHIPSKINQFTGRDRDMQSTLKDMASNQLMVITGSPGIGKTTFAIEIAHQLLKDDSTLIINFIDLQYIDSIETILTTILHHFRKTPEDKPIEQLCNLLSSLKRNVVIIFDNSEDALTENLKNLFLNLIKQLLSKCATLKLLCTSRMKFCLWGINCKEQILHPLEVEDALSLLRFSVPGLCAEDARKLAVSCGCAPLALWIIAMLVQDGGFSPDRLIKEIDPNNPNPIDGYYVEYLSENCQMKAIINLSYVKLSPKLQNVFCSLSVFPSSFDINAAEFVADTQTIERELSALKLRSLLSYEPVSNRYSMHPYIRAFAKCQKENSINNLIVKFGIHYASLLKHLTGKFYSRDFRAAVEEFQLEKPNIIKMLMSVTENNELYETCRILADKFVVRFIYMFVPVEHYISFYTELLEIARKKDDMQTCSLSYFCLGCHYRYIYEWHKAIDMFTIALSVSEKPGLCEMDVALCQSYIAWCYSFLNDNDKALYYLNSIQDVVDRNTNQSSLSMAYLLKITSSTYSRIRQAKESLIFGKLALELWEHFLEDHLDTARQLYNLGLFHFRLGRYEEALPYLARSGKIHNSLVFKSRDTVDNYRLLAVVCNKLQKFKQALTFFSTAADIEETIRGPDSEKLKHIRYDMEQIQKKAK